jgi:signal transduction histidine kinase
MRKGRRRATIGAIEELCSSSTEDGVMDAKTEGIRRSGEPSDRLAGLRGAKLLVVDDNVEAGTGLQLLFSHEGAVVTLARDGVEAVAAVKSSGADVVLTDLRMPRLDGIGLCQALHALDPRLPVILMTSYGDMGSAIAGLRAGATDFLMKPLDMDVVFHSVHRALEQRAAYRERQRLRARNEELYREMRQTSREQEDVLSMVVHDLRNPLGAVLLIAQQLVSLRGEAADPVTGGELILRNVRRMKELVDELLDRARVRRGELRCGPHLLSDVLNDIEDLRPIAQAKHIELEIHPSDEGLAVWCDRARVARVFSNLVGNALGVAPAGSKVTVRADSGSDGVTISVADEGPGIAAEDAEQMFEPFWKKEEGVPGSGAGLGLFIAKEIVVAHGGTIEVQSAKGATFRVFLPRRDRG